MSIDRTLPFLIERASQARDVAAQALAQAQRAEVASHERMAQLREFRKVCIARTPTATGVVATADAIAAHHRFLVKLDHAILVQQEEIAARARETLAQHEKLLERQRSVLALEALQKRRQLLRDARATRVMQREADEFASRALQRARLETA